ncbi:MAG TPA: L-histidine N(alpha)-methyltransferase [Planctomycetota bacterium]
MLSSGTNRPAAARFELLSVGGAAEEDLAAAVARGLRTRERSLPCRFFYDARGSELFERICGLDEYYLTRDEEAILRTQAAAIVAAVPADACVVELGSGSSAKTRTLLRAFLKRKPRLHYLPIDISESALEGSAENLLAEFPGLRITALHGEYRAALARLHDRPGPKLVLWLGSSVGNFERAGAAAFLAGVRAQLGAEDRLLLGVDLRKDARALELAYDDPGGVTAEFNLNLLARINRELGADFDLSQWRHVAQWRPDPGHVEIHLESRVAQTVHVAALEEDFEFDAGERVHTENSAKYGLDEIDILAERAGFSVGARWLGAAARFSVNLLAPAG